MPKAKRAPQPAWRVLQLNPQETEFLHNLASLLAPQLKRKNLSISNLFRHLAGLPLLEIKGGDRVSEEFKKKKAEREKKELDLDS